MKPWGRRHEKGIEDSKGEDTDRQGDRETHGWGSDHSRREKENSLVRERKIVTLASLVNLLR
jgi:hypothetical protein